MTNTFSITAKFPTKTAELSLNVDIDRHTVTPTNMNADLKNSISESGCRCVQHGSRPGQDPLEITTKSGVSSPFGSDGSDSSDGSSGSKSPTSSDESSSYGSSSDSSDSGGDDHGSPVGGNAPGQGYDFQQAQREKEKDDLGSMAHGPSNSYREKLFYSPGKTRS